MKNEMKSLAQKAEKSGLILHLVIQDVNKKLATFRKSLYNNDVVRSKKGSK